MAQTGGKEIEVKLRAADLIAAEGKVKALAGEPSKPRIFESNVVLDTPELTLKQRGELIRVRTVGEERVLTYKGVGDPGSKHKSREEIEVNLDDAEKLERIFERLGYTPSFRYEKYRTEYSYESGTITIDETPIGGFLELEGASEWIDSTAQKLGFREQDYVKGSYAELYREYCLAKNLPVRHMVFG